MPENIQTMKDYADKIDTYLKSIVEKCSAHTYFLKDCQLMI